MAQSLPQPEHRRAPNETTSDSWVDQVADRVSELLREEGLGLGS